jgi:predicted nucleotidyltransferase
VPSAYPEAMGARKVRPRLSGHDVAQLLADRLAGVFGPRLRRVILFGSWARGEASWEDSDVDLLVVLDVIDDHRAENKRIDAVADELFMESGHPVAAFPVAEAELASPTRLSVRSALREGVDFTPARV